jgi:hypothetical protein
MDMLGYSMSKLQEQLLCSFFAPLLLSWVYLVRDIGPKENIGSKYIIEFLAIIVSIFYNS